MIRNHPRAFYCRAQGLIAEDTFSFTLARVRKAPLGARLVAIALACGLAGVALVGTVSSSAAATIINRPTVPAITPAPTGRVFHTPASIPANCSQDVTVALNRWIASVPNNSTLEFPRKACYEIEGSLFVDGRHSLLFNGNGSEFLAKTTGAKATPPPGRQHTDWPNARAQWWIMDGSDITLENMVIHGAANIEAPYEGMTWGSRKERHDYIGQYGVRFAGTDGGILRGSTITDTFSDLVGVTADYPGKLVGAQPARNITIVDNVLERSDRDGPSVYDGVNILIAHNTISDVWGPVIDLEPVATRWEVDNVTVLDNTAGTHAHYFMTADGASATNDNLLFEGNTDTAGNMMMSIGSRSTSPPIRQNVQIIDNQATQKNGLGMGALISVRGIRGLVILGNQAPVSGGAAVSLYKSSDLTLRSNRFPGSSAKQHPHGR